MKKNYFNRRKTINSIAFALFSCATLLTPSLLYASNNDYELLQQVENPLDSKLSMSVKEVDMAKFIAEIKKALKKDVFFIYTEDISLQAGKISVNMQNVTLSQLMIAALKGKNITFAYQNNAIVLKKVVELKNQLFILKAIVVDEYKAHLPGATVVTKNSNKGAISDEKGRVSISVHPNDTLVVEYIGMKPYNHIVKFGDKDLVFSMQRDAINVEDVIVTGYQTIDKRMLTSSVEKIDRDDMDRIGALTVDQMLEGKAAGMLVTNLSATPGAASKIRVRSGGTFTGSRAPLWVVDGMIYEDPVPLSADDINSYDNVNLIGNALTGINPQDIESINILKDASATAIYGTRAANGVIVITTRRGKVGNASISYSGNLIVQDRPRYENYELMNSAERIDVSRELAQKGYGYPSDLYFPFGYEGAVSKYKKGILSYKEFQEEVAKLETSNVDWFGALYRPIIKHSHSINISGGSDNVRYYTSVGYDDDKGTERGVSLNRITARSNLDVKLNKNVDISVGISGSSQEANYNHSSVKMFNEAYYKSRAVPAYNEDGTYAYNYKKIATHANKNNFARHHILNEIDESGNKVINNDFNINAQLKWLILKGIVLRASGSYRNTTTLTEEYITDKTFHIAQLRTYDAVEDKIDHLVRNDASVAFGGLFSNGNTRNNSLMGQVQLNFNKTFAEKHLFNLNLGYEANSIKYGGVNNAAMPGYNHTQGKSFIQLPAFGIDQNTGDIVGYSYSNMLKWLTDDIRGKSIYPSITSRVSNKMSMFLIFNYSFTDRYVLNFNMRSDGSNQFGQYEKYKFKPTWSVSGRWNIHKEPYLKDFTSMDELALRVSYGFRGNPPSDLPYMVIRDFIENPKYNEHTAIMNSFPNSNLTWEKTSTLNLGISHSWFGGRLSGSFDFAYSKSTDLLLSTPVSLVNGQSTQRYNGGSKKDYTYEVSLRANIIKMKDFGFNLGANFTTIKEEILSGYTANSVFDIDINKYLNGGIYLSGFPIDAFYSYKFNGLDDKGLPTYADLADAPKDGLFSTYFKNALDYSGVRSPKYYGGFNVDFRYKNLNLRASFSYKFGHHIRLLNLYGNAQNIPMPYENMNSIFVDRWRNPGDEAFTDIPALSTELLPAGENKSINTWTRYVVDSKATGWSMYNLSDERVVKGDHIRINNVTLSYRVPTKFLQKINLKNLTTSLQVANLGVIAFDKRLKGQDPEQVQNIGMPTLPTYTLNLQFSF